MKGLAGLQAMVIGENSLRDIEKQEESIKHETIFFNFLNLKHNVCLAQE